jgi:hypothetical protein
MIEGIEMIEDQREIRRKKRVFEYAEWHGNIKTTCLRFGIARSALHSPCEGPRPLLLSKVGTGAVHPIGWSKEFLEAGKRQLADDTAREATSDEVREFRTENSELEEVVAEFTLKTGCPRIVELGKFESRIFTNVQNAGL